jgi:type VI protein secretion system component VasK
VTLLQTQYDRPQEGLQRGRYPMPQWVVAAVGAAVVLGALFFLIWRARRAKKAQRDEESRPSRRRR